MRKKFKKIRYLIEYLIIIIFFYTIRCLPLRFLFFFANIFGIILYFIPSFRKLCIANIKIAFPEKTDCEIRKIARRSLQNISKTVIELFWFSGRQNYLYSIMKNSNEGVEITRESMKEGGMIWISPHIGNWELAAFNISFATKLPFAVLIRPQNNPYINTLIVKSRTSSGNKVIFEKGAVKEMIKLLKKGHFLAVLIDQNTRVRDGGVFVDFFGLPVPTSRAIAFFARKMKVNIALGGCLREGNFYKMFSKKLPKKITDYKSDEELVQDIMKLTEEIIREYPEQYLWLYKRWQYIPNDIPDELRRKFPYYSFDAPPRFYDKTVKKSN